MLKDIKMTLTPNFKYNTTEYESIVSYPFTKGSLHLMESIKNKKLKLFYFPKFDCFSVLMKRKIRDIINGVIYNDFIEFEYSTISFILRTKLFYNHYACMYTNEDIKIRDMDIKEGYRFFSSCSIGPIKNGYEVVILKKVKDIDLRFFIHKFKKFENQVRFFNISEIFSENSMEIEESAIEQLIAKFILYLSFVNSFITNETI